MGKAKTKQKRPSATRAIKAKCYECCGFFDDGRHDCGIPTCPLYYWHLYRQMEPTVWFKGEVKGWSSAYNKAKREEKG